MTLQVDDVAERALARILSALRTTRLEAGLSQKTLASSLPVRGRAISEWETGAVKPSLGNLLQWSHRLGRGLEITDLHGNLWHGRTCQRPGESWESFERRRLAMPLRSRRVALGMSQDEVGRLVGVSRDSIQRWELACVPPRPIALVVWAQRLECSVDLRPIGSRTAR